MAYSKEFKFRVIKHVNMGISSIPQVAEVKRIPKQTVYNWIHTYRKFGEEGLENRKPGAKEIQINPNFEGLVLDEWKKKKKLA